MIALPMFNLVGIPVSMLPPAPRAADVAPVCAVRLINRRTGLPHRINGTPLELLTRAPEEAGRDLLRNRDTTEWRVEVVPLPRPSGST
ncbi:MAG: hypothetical protein V4712_00590 [Pseudomonadota bacterium]